MANISTVTPPDITGVINQQFFIERLGGAAPPKNYLEHFPETLYNRAYGSNLVALLYTLLGPAGVGSLRQNYLLARLAIEAHGLRTTDLDELYANPFSFARFASESYEQDTEGLLTQAQWETIIRSDKSYQNRAMNYLKAIRAGGTLLGMTLAAKSGLDKAVEVVENYRALFDRYSDEPLELEYIGATESTEEIILVPRQELPKSALQILRIEGNAIEGGFTLALPIGPGETRENFSASNSTTGFIEYNATFDLIREKLEALETKTKVPLLRGNINVRGGQFPGNPIEVEFKDALADRPVPALLVIENTMKDREGLPCTLVVEEAQAGVAADGEIATIPPEDYHFAVTAIDNIKPVTTIVSLGRGTGVTKRQIANTATADSEFYEVLRYVIGNRSLAWPAVDSTHWIVSGVEKEAPIAIDSQTNHYTNFHNIFGVSAYTDEGVANPYYETAKWAELLAKYQSIHTGPFSPAQQLLFPFLKEWSEAKTIEAIRFVPTFAPTNPPELLSFHEENIIGRSYPSDYIELGKNTEREKFHAFGSGLGITTLAPSFQDKPPSETTPFWASMERTEGADFLEIDLGNVQGVNYINFEVSNKPFDIDVAYDLLDAEPERRFKGVTYPDPKLAASVLSVGHDIEAPNPWRTVEISFENSLNMMVFTKFIRLEFKRRTGEASPFTEASGGKHPFSVEVRNLRVGRNIS